MLGDEKIVYNGLPKTTGFIVRESPNEYLLVEVFNCGKRTVVEIDIKEKGNITVFMDCRRLE